MEYYDWFSYVFRTLLQFNYDASCGSFIERKTVVPETVGTFRTDNSLFGGIFIGTIVIVGALTFFPMLVLGPIAEFLTLK